MKMKITVNGKQIELSEKTNTIIHYLKAEKVDERGIAVALNNEVIPKSLWDKTELKENDNLLIITATQGG